jgi:hypothetical protein
MIAGIAGFYEMGTDGGLVDFPALMREIVRSGYDGWLTVEHDKAELGGGSYAEATAVAKWTSTMSSPGRRPRWRQRDEGHAAVGVRPQPVELPARCLRPARGPAAGAQDDLRLRLRRRRAARGNRPVGQIAANFGSLAGFREFLASCAIGAVSSWFYDPQQRSMEHLTPPFSPLVAADLPGIVARAEEFAAALAELGGSVLLVPGGPPAGTLTQSTTPRCSSWLPPRRPRLRDRLPGG